MKMVTEAMIVDEPYWKEHVELRKYKGRRAFEHNLKKEG